MFKSLCCCTEFFPPTVMCVLFFNVFRVFFLILLLILSIYRTARILLNVNHHAFKRNINVVMVLHASIAVGFVMVKRIVLQAMTKRPQIVKISHAVQTNFNVPTNHAFPVISIARENQNAVMVVMS